MKKFIFFSVLVSVVLGAMFVFTQTDSPMAKNVIHQTGESKDTFPVLPVNATSSRGPNNSAQEQSLVVEEKPRRNSSGIEGTPAEAEVVRNWQQERGYLGRDRQKLEEYKGFDISTLKIMIDSGDLLAQSALIRRSIGEMKTREIYKALAMGSTEAVMMLGIEREVAYEEKVEAGDESDALVNEVLAVYEMGALRGDRYNQIVLQNDFIKKHNIQLTEEDKKAIRQRGKELYDEIQQKRFELGLDEFENTVPSEVNNYYNNLYKFTYEGAFRD